MRLRRHIVTQPVIILTGSHSFPLSNQAQIVNPSSRLRCTVEVFFEFDSSPLIGPASITNYNGEWSLRARTPGIAARGTPYLHYLIGPSDPLVDRQLPHSYNFTGSLDIVEVTLTLTGNPQHSSGSIGAGTWSMRVIWEPDTLGEVDDCELQQLFDRCAVACTALVAT